ncbi:MAG: DUF2953 domain-containing protein [Oscillospiraceae bacterium]|nr:DUF2953 domain-containing protein [Oscillospiraceae bacterium]
MTALMVIASIFTFFAVLALLRIGVIIEYCDEGLNSWCKFCFIKWRIKTDSKKKKVKRKKKRDFGKMKPGNLQGFLALLAVIKGLLARLKRKLLIVKLCIIYTSASDNPAAAAIGYGAANAVYAVIMPILERHFRIKRKDLRAAADFESNKPGIYAKLSISMAIWECIYVLIALLPLFNMMEKTKETENDTIRKED